MLRPLRFRWLRITARVFLHDRINIFFQPLSDNTPITQAKALTINSGLIV